MQYYHTELRNGRAGRSPTGLRSGQIRRLGGRRLILLRTSKNRGEWIVGYYGDGTTADAETRTSRELAAAGCEGWVQLSIRVEP